MGDNSRAPIDTATIRQAYTAGLDVWGYCPPEPEVWALLRDQLTGHVQLLLPEIKGVAARMRGETRLTAVHVIRRAHHGMEGMTGTSPLAQSWHIQDLVVIARALLILYENPGPLGAPSDGGEIEEAVQRKVCGACWQKITNGEGYERAVFASGSGPGIRGYRHTDSCAPPSPRRGGSNCVPCLDRRPRPLEG
ncbi:DUF6415 family natural product biosynthesis protein [Streptomyces sp. CA-251387]|uniref:DUF6415 family natural product biosynthesis protein n=1 Tax=Streptomyces sp. CA-251387 TaxID=3240064 RepID=UPI003D8F570C